MSIREMEKDLKAKLNYKLEYLALIFLVMFMFTLGVFIMLGYDIGEAMVWDFRKVLVMFDLYLNCFFHRLFESVTVPFALIGQTHSVSEYLTLLKNSVTYIWNESPIYFIPQQYLATVNNYHELQVQSYRYFWLIVITFLSWFYIINYFFRLFPLPLKVRRIIYYPLNLIFFNILPEDYLEKIGASTGNFFSVFEKNVINQTIETEDGYQRVDKLKYLNTIPAIISSGGKYKKELFHIRQCFKSDNHFQDLFQIVEGYLAPKGKPKLFDEYVPELTKDEYEDWKAFNNRDCVYFSPDAILYFIDKESAEYVSFLNRKMIRGRSYLAKFLLDYKDKLIADRIRVTSMLFGINNNEKKLRVNDEEILSDYEKMIKEAVQGDKDVWWELFKERLVVVMNAYFRFVLLRAVLREYTNIPAGTIVAKLEDYTLRNIIDNYDMESLVAISDNKNDGLSQSFENDLISNIFFMSYYIYNRKVKKTTIDERLKDKWNMDVSDTFENEEEKRLSETFKKLEEYKKQQEGGE